MERIDRLSRTSPSLLGGLLVGVAGLDLARLAVMVGVVAIAAGVLGALAVGLWCGRELLRRPAPDLVRLIATAVVTVVAAAHIGEGRWTPSALAGDALVLVAVGATLAALQARAGRHASSARPALRLIQGGAA